MALIQIIQGSFVGCNCHQNLKILGASGDILHVKIDGQFIIMPDDQDIPEKCRTFYFKKHDARWIRLLSEEDVIQFLKDKEVNIEVM